MRITTTLLRVRGRYERNVSSHLFKRRLQLRLSRPIVSFSFDDFPKNALTAGGTILRRHGVVGTYYASLGLMGQVVPTGLMFDSDDLAQLNDEGHELGCHTYSHCHSWDTASPVFEADIIRNQRALAGLCPDQSFRTFSYPISNPWPLTKMRVRGHYRASRAGGQCGNVGVIDLNQLSAFFLEKCQGDFASIRAIIDRNAASCGWLIFATHDVSELPTPYGCTPAFFEAVVEHTIESGAVVLPVGRALDAALSSSVTTTS